ncbi:hypothetical protein [Streptomyces noursei]|uniref:hypothetical protein n=1 Tax=Streptomyces noursei TaxID=1971 RepID=UPI0023B7BE36|nr:hypothetical protein [Streptomyces noursei]
MAESCSTVRERAGSGSAVPREDGDGAPPQGLRWAGRGDGGHAVSTPQHGSTGVARGPIVRAGAARARPGFPGTAGGHSHGAGAGPASSGGPTVSGMDVPARVPARAAAAVGDGRPVATPNSGSPG